ncbi:hypothetical protein METSCH_F00890 [Metschnikowia aff. pulcherrima]|uniref:Uncharacterized protein n=2 Tax=Metschnikowia TaxID=27320 RepID=A0A4P6XW52_9ASCO|nr:hypothetical protein METSCH_F00890 [Metschnikowia aff. pulcherrima]
MVLQSSYCRKGMNARLNYTKIGPRLAVAQAITSHVTADYLMTLPLRQRLISVYKRMYKLRFMVGDSQSQQNDFCNLLRRKFSRQDFDTRRNKLLGLSEKLPEDVFTERLANTYAFVFNATCEPDGAIPSIRFYEDLKAAMEVRSETNVLRTILMMEREYPPLIKYDHTYEWVDSVKQFYTLAMGDILNKEYNKLASTKTAHFIGYYQYEKTLAQLNESLTLCL